MLALQIACLGWSLGSVYSRRHARAENALGRVCAQDIVDEGTGEILIEANDEITPEDFKE